MKKATLASKKIAVIDFETDPFLHGRTPKPFAAGFYDGENYTQFWGDDCAQELIYFLDELRQPHLIYAHNGGKFDFHFLLPYFDGKVKIINRRLVQAEIGRHTFRDSYAAIPIPLSAYAKTDIDYHKFEQENREANKKEIGEYLKDDCVFLHQLISKFCIDFNRALTIGGASIKELIKLHEFDRANKWHDEKFREYYFGGRVQCFERGIITGNFKMYDVNSMYPACMKNFRHPTGKKYITVKNKSIDKRGRIVGIADCEFYFAKINATVIDGGLPVRQKTGLDFSVKKGIFFTTSHELKLLIKMNMIVVHEVIEAHAPFETISFGDFVDIYSAKKIKAKKDKDKPGEIFAKLILNSSYGKFAQNPETYMDYLLVTEAPGDDWQLGAVWGDFHYLYERPAKAQAYYDVAVGASITSAARSILLQALLTAQRPIYCDTDSIICEKLNSDIHDTRLGAWKFEHTLDKVAIAGKKLYAVYENGECVKHASKGVRFTPQQILNVANGETETWKSDAPNFSLTKPPTFIDRKIERLF